MAGCGGGWREPRTSPESAASLHVLAATAPSHSPQPPRRAAPRRHTPSAAPQPRAVQRQKRLCGKAAQGTDNDQTCASLSITLSITSAATFLEVLMSVQHQGVDVTVSLTSLGQHRRRRCCHASRIAAGSGSSYSATFHGNIHRVEGQQQRRASRRITIHSASVAVGGGGGGGLAPRLCCTALRRSGCASIIDISCTHQSSRTCDDLCVASGWV